MAISMLSDSRINTVGEDIAGVVQCSARVAVDPASPGSGLGSWLLSQLRRTTAPL